MANFSRKRSPAIMIRHWAIRWALLVVLICLADCQITFSRTWVRGKHPGEESGGNAEEVPSFFRAAKSSQDIGDDDFRIRASKSLRNARARFVGDILYKLKYPSSNRYKDMDLPFSISVA